MSSLAHVCFRDLKRTPRPPVSDGSVLPKVAIATLAEQRELEPELHADLAGDTDGVVILDEALAGGAEHHAACSDMRGDEIGSLPITLSSPPGSKVMLCALPES